MMISLRLVVLTLAALAVAKLGPVSGKGERIGIIGGGVGGAALALFLRDELGDRVSLTVIESESQIGGRLKSFKSGNLTFELGASIGADGNHYFQSLSERMNLTTATPEVVEGDFVIFNGQRILFRSAPTVMGNMYRFVKRYGASIFATAKLVLSLIARFKTVYQRQDDGVFFRSSLDLWRNLSLDYESQLRLNDTLRTAYAVGSWSPITEPFIDEFVGAITRINYNQSPRTISALAGLVALAPLLAEQVFTIEGGNVQLPERLIQASKCRVRLNHNVVRLVARQRHGKTSWKVYVEGKKQPYHFDKVVIAAPLNTSKISIQGPGLNLPDPHPYQDVHVTFVEGKINKRYFGLQKSDELPATIGTTESNRTRFSSLSVLRATPDGRDIMKLFSRQRLPSEFMLSVFEMGYKVLYHKLWKAYPKFSPPEELPSFVVADGLYYLNAIENAASAVELSLISAKNAALMIGHELKTGTESHHDRLKDQL